MNPLIGIAIVSSVMSMAKSKAEIEAVNRQAAANAKAAIEADKLADASYENVRLQLYDQLYTARRKAISDRTDIARATMRSKATAVAAAAGGSIGTRIVNKLSHVSDVQRGFAIGGVEDALGDFIAGTEMSNRNAWDVRRGRNLQNVSTVTAAQNSRVSPLLGALTVGASGLSTFMNIAGPSFT